MNLKDFLIENKINYTLYNLTSTNLYDIIIYDKKIEQTVITNRIQYNEDQEERLDKNKKEYSKTHLFLKNNFEVGTYKIAALEPGSLVLDNCETCDGHGTIICPNCHGKGELNCPKCSGKGIIETQEIKQKTQTHNCPQCNGTKIITYDCNNCGGTGQLKYYEPCRSCFGKGTLINPQTNQQIYCQQCFGKGNIERVKPCTCSNGKITQPCPTCKGLGSITSTENYTERKINDCLYCNKTGKIDCNVCHGSQEITCTTCKGSRRTYQGYLNNFKIKVSLNPQLLLFKELPPQALKTIGLEEKNIVKTIDPNEKKELAQYGVTNSLKIEKDLISRINGTLYTLKSLDHGNLYYIWFSKTSQKFYFINLPPKDKFEDFLITFGKILLVPIKFILKYYNKLIIKINGKRNY